MVLSPRSLSYARLAIQSLFQHSEEGLSLTLLTDSAADKTELQTALAEIGIAERHQATVLSENDLEDAEAQRFAHLPNLRRFRHGHPCWRKITDPVLAATPGDEMLLLDPDLFFPNRFRFEPTPPNGLLLMWQKPNCLFPPNVVRAAMDANIPLARHVDIGVSHWRLSADLHELEWIDWLIGKIGGASLPRIMHVEAIVWSAIAMHLGGGFLDPQYWVCWHRTQGKRVRRKLGATGRSILASEPWQQMKCFHAGGEAKWLLTEMEAAGEIPQGKDQLSPGRILPFTELTTTRYNYEQIAKKSVGFLGYHRLFAAGSK